MNSLNNISERYMNALFAFFKENRWVLAIAFLAGFYVYGFDITTFSLSIDEETNWNATNFNEWVGQGRWGMYLLQLLLPSLVYPFTASVFAIFIIALSAVLAVSHQKTDNGSKIIFATLVIIFPFYAHIQEFTFMVAHCAVSVFFAVVSYRFYRLAFEKSKLFLLPSVLLLAFSAGIYQSYLFIFFIPLFIDLISDYINKKTSYLFAIKRIVYSILFTICAVALYYVINELLLIFLGLQISYIDNFFKWGSEPISKTIGELAVGIYRVYMGIRQFYSLITPFCFIALFGACFCYYHSLEKRKLIGSFQLFSLLLLMMFAGTGSMIALGGQLPPRSLLAVPFAYAGLIYFYYILGGKFVKAVIICFTIFSTLYNGSFVTKLFLSDYFTTESDKIIATRVLDQIYDVAPNFYYGGHPVAFLGRIGNRPASPLLAKHDVFGGSFWNWDNGNPTRMILFMRSFGLPANVPLAQGVLYEKARRYALSIDMPVFPDKGSVIWHDGVVIVRLSK